MVCADSKMFVPSSVDSAVSECETEPYAKAPNQPSASPDTKTSPIATSFAKTSPFRRFTACVPRLFVSFNALGVTFDVTFLAQVFVSADFAASITLHEHIEPRPRLG